jgi:hypothetical protein
MIANLSHARKATPCRRGGSRVLSVHESIKDVARSTLVVVPEKQLAATSEIERS